jgi:hypothetical protein
MPTLPTSVEGNSGTDRRILKIDADDLKRKRTRRKNRAGSV